MKKKRWTAGEIRDLRELMELTQEDFSKRLGVTRHYIYLLEAHKKTPSETIRLLLDYVEGDRKGTKP